MYFIEGYERWGGGGGGMKCYQNLLGLQVYFPQQKSNTHHSNKVSGKVSFGNDDFGSMSFWCKSV